MYNKMAHVIVQYTNKFLLEFFPNSLVAYNSWSTGGFADDIIFEGYVK